MIVACKARVSEILQGLTPPIEGKDIYTSKAALGGHITTPRIVLIAARDKTKPDGVLVGQRVEGAKRIYTYRRAVRELQLQVVVLHRTEPEAEAVLEGIVAGLLDGLTVDGQPVTVWTSDTAWIDQESIQRQEAQATAALGFEHGIFREKEVPILGGLGIEGEEIS